MSTPISLEKFILESSIGYDGNFDIFIITITIDKNAFFLLQLIQ